MNIKKQNKKYLLKRNFFFTNCRNRFFNFSCVFVYLLAFYQVFLRVSKFFFYRSSWNLNTVFLRFYVSLMWLDIPYSVYHFSVINNLCDRHNIMNGFLFNKDVRTICNVMTHSIIDIWQNFKNNRIRMFRIV